MEVILLEKIAKLGSLGDRVSIKAGYGRNYLIPQGKAVPATAARIAEFEVRRAELEKIAAEKLSAAQIRAAKLAALSITIPHKAGDEGRLFGSVGAHAIVDAINITGVEIDKSEVRLPHGSLRHIGEHEIHLHLHGDVNVVMTISIVAE